MIQIHKLFDYFRVFLTVFAKKYSKIILKVVCFFLVSFLKKDKGKPEETQRRKAIGAKL